MPYSGLALFCGLATQMSRAVLRGVHSFNTAACKREVQGMVIMTNPFWRVTEFPMLFQTFLDVHAEPRTRDFAARKAQHIMV
jgi:hypothetical protein